MSKNTTSQALQSFEIEKAFQKAVRLHQRGRLKQAESRYSQIVDTQPNHAGALHLLGVLAHQAGRNDDALELINKALSVNEGFAAAHYNLGTVLQAEQRNEEAITHYQRAIELDPDYADAHLNLGNVYFESKEFKDALSCYDRAIELDLENARAHKNRSRALTELGQSEAAIEAAERSVQLEPENAIIQFEYANALRGDARLEEAAKHYELALEADPDFLGARCNYGSVLSDLNRLDDAIGQLEKVVELDPESCAAMVNIGSILHKKGEMQEAVDMYQKALDVDPDYPEAYCNLGRVLSDQAMFNEALACFQKAMQIKPGFAEAYVNLGSVMQSLGLPEESLKAYQIALTLKPNMDMAYWNLALALLASGRLQEGWDLFSYGFKSLQRKPLRPFPGLIWEGESLEDKTIMVWKEQGIGDDLRFSTVYHDLIEQAGHVIIETDKRLVPLYQRTWPQATVRAETYTSTGRGDMEHPDFDVTAPAGNAASFLRRRLDQFPSPAKFLKPDPAKVEMWRAKLAELGPGPKIGLSWRSSLMTAGRSFYYTEPEDWLGLFDIKDAHIINLQYDDAGPEIAKLNERQNITLHQMPDIDLYNDLDGAAALTKALDIVVTASTSVADMSGALGVPAFSYGMRKHPAMLGTNHIPWLPSLHWHGFSDAEELPEIIQSITKEVTALASNMSEDKS